MNKWTIQLIGLTLLLAVVAACGGEPATDRTPTPISTATPTVVAPAQVPADWHLVEVPRGEPRFSLRLPPGWQLNELQGIDSIVGEIVGEGVRLGFDFGWYSNSLADDDDPVHTVTYEDIGGRRAKLVRPKEGVEGSVGVYFEDFDNRGEASFSLDLLTIVGMDLSAEQQKTAFTIFRSVRDYEGDLTPGPTSGVGPGISIGEAITSDLQGPLLINGHLHAQNGQVRLCELLAESFPPLCGGRSLAVKGLDLTTMAGLTSEGSVTWSDQLVQVLGTVEGEVLTAAGTDLGGPGICCKPVPAPTATPKPEPTATTGSSFSVSVVELAIASGMLALAIALVVGGVVVYRRTTEAIERRAATVAVAGGFLVLATLALAGVVSAPASLMWLLLFIELGLLGTAFWLWMLVDCALNEPTVGTDKLIWVLIILFAQVLGATLYLLVRRPQRLAMAQS